MNRTHRILVGVVVAGAVVIAAIGFAGSYTAVRELALSKGFGWFAGVFPVGIDAGIVVLLSLDLLLTWLRIPFPLLRQTAWLLTAATIAFNGAAAWPDPLGVGMHGIIPVLFVVSVEAARHAIGRVADITADRHMESVRLARWLLAFPSTFRLWRRMKLWELRSYDEVIKLEQDRLVYRARLRARYGRAWRRRAPVEALMPLRLARYGVPLAETGPAGLAAAGIEVPSPQSPPPSQNRELVAASPVEREPQPVPEPAPVPTPEPQPQPEYVPEPAGPTVTVPVGPGRRRTLAGGKGSPTGNSQSPYVPPPRAESAQEPEHLSEPEQPPLPNDMSLEDAYFHAYRTHIAEHGTWPTARQFGRLLFDLFGIQGSGGGPLSESDLRPRLRELRERYRMEMQTEHVP